ncbi:MAG TPA: DUF4440 domain-containing protein [Blastocatellia bacterium]|nr:DUF4440 domain-containing protein [Blastocatellia bacterium]
MTPDRRVAFSLMLFLLSGIVMSCASKQEALSADVEAINKLHQREVEASRKWDIDTLVSLWSDDVVMLPAGEPALIGKDANRASIMRLRDESGNAQIADYILSFNEVKVAGDWAFEWGTYSGTVTPEGGGDSLRATGKVIRVLKKGADGTWRIARAMYNNDQS